MLSRVPELETIRRKTARPINANFFCHQPPQEDHVREINWRQCLDAYYIQLQVDSNTFLRPRPRGLYQADLGVRIESRIAEHSRLQSLIGAELPRNGPEVRFEEVISALGIDSGGITSAERSPCCQNTSECSS
jgi:hypothetical protein